MNCQPLRACLALLALFVAGTAGADYTKIANNGWELPAGAALGKGDIDWACTRDNVSGLVWEVKTADGGLRDQNKTYTNYDDPNQPQKSNGSAYVNPTQAEIDAGTNSIGFVKAVNAAGLCGQANWRMPTMNELFGLLVYGSTPAINAAYFPNTPAAYFWSSSVPFADRPFYARFVGFDRAFADFNYRSTAYQVRLVRAEQSISHFDLTVGPTGSGAGSVIFGGANICSVSGGVASGACAARPSNGAQVMLIAVAAPGSTLSWGGACAGSTGTTCTLTMDAAKSVTADFSLPVFSSNLLAATGYTKIANNGWELPARAALGNGPFDWACTRDNATGLVWEVKTSDGGVRDMNVGYTNYDDPNQAQAWNGSAYVNPTQAEIDAGTNSIGFVKAVNAAGLCGRNDWRLPTKDELFGLVVQGGSPSINSAYFPNTASSLFWSSSPVVGAPSDAWGVVFNNGYEFSYTRRGVGEVRLVRNFGQSVDNFNLSVQAAGSGSGSVVVGGSNDVCSLQGGVVSGTCAVRPGSGAWVALAAIAAPGSTLTWGGACAGASGVTCALTMDSVKSVTADFSLPAVARDILVDPTTSLTLYAGLDAVGVYVSTNSGGSWTAAATQPANLSVKALAKKIGTPLYAGTYGGGVFKAATGTDFVVCQNQPANANVLSLTLDAAGKLYAGTEGGVFVSSNQCDSWTALNTGLPN